MQSALRPFLLACLLATGFLAGQLLVYEPFVVPRLATWSSVPFVWWLASIAPAFAVCVWAALSLQSVRSKAAFSSLGALLVVTMQFAAGTYFRAGHVKVVEGGLLHVGVQLVLVAALILASVGAVAILLTVYRRARAG